jgi:Protein of unknown function (DUF5818)
MHRTKLPPTLAALLLAGLLVAACADPGGDGGGAATGGAASTTSPPSTASPPSTVPDRRTEPTKQGAAVTVTGTVRAGVEPGCLLLEDQAGGRFLLVGGDRARLSPGSRVAVTGRVDRGLLSTCQQGEPLVVASIAAAP